MTSDLYCGTVAGTVIEHLRLSDVFKLARWNKTGREVEEEEEEQEEEVDPSVPNVVFNCYIIHVKHLVRV